MPNGERAPLTVGAPGEPKHHVGDIVGIALASGGEVAAEALECVPNPLVPEEPFLYRLGPPLGLLCKSKVPHNFGQDGSNGDCVFDARGTMGICRRTVILNARYTSSYCRCWRDWPANSSGDLADQTSRNG